jgi:predicted aminopeptidase
MRTLALCLGLTTLPACTTLQYGLHITGGHLDLMQKRVPASALLAGDALPGPDRDKLALSQQARTYASQVLGLPENASYRTLSRLDTPYPVWNVYVTPAFALEARQSCFPIAGCVPYRGYFDRTRAEQAATAYRQQGDDVLVAPAIAYSTLGWYSDPLTPAMLTLPDWRLAGVIFHELAHQVLYVPGDAVFNESFARTVEIEGTRQWLVRHGNDAQRSAFEAGLQRQERFATDLRELRLALTRLYAQPLPAAEKHLRKAELFAQYRQRQQDRAVADPAWQGYADWFAEANNAKLLAHHTYQAAVPAFSRLLAESGRDWPGFYARARIWAALPPPARQARLGLRDQADAAATASVRAR